jgi:outer membrane biosynthesis protein TonB
MDALVDSAVGGGSRGNRAAAVVVRLRPGLGVTGASRAALEPRLRSLVAALGPRLRSVRGGQRGTLALRLTVGTNGRVSHVAFVSGTLAQNPGLSAELERLLRAWQLGALPAETTIAMTLAFS